MPSLTTTNSSSSIDALAGLKTNAIAAAKSGPAIIQPSDNYRSGTVTNFQGPTSSPDSIPIAMWTNEQQVLSELEVGPNRNPIPLKSQTNTSAIQLQQQWQQSQIIPNCQQSSPEIQYQQSQTQQYGTHNLQLLQAQSSVADSNSSSQHQLQNQYHDSQILQQQLYGNSIQTQGQGHQNLFVPNNVIQQGQQNYKFQQYSLTQSQQHPQQQLQLSSTIPSRTTASQNHIRPNPNRYNKLKSHGQPNSSTNRGPGTGLNGNNINHNPKNSSNPNRNRSNNRTANPMQLTSTQLNNIVTLNSIPGMATQIQCHGMSNSSLDFLVALTQNNQQQQYQLNQQGHGGVRGHRQNNRGSTGLHGKQFGQNYTSAFQNNQQNYSNHYLNNHQCHDTRMPIQNQTHIIANDYSYSNHHLYRSMGLSTDVARLTTNQNQNQNQNFYIPARPNKVYADQRVQQQQNQKFQAQGSENLINLLSLGQNQQDQSQSQLSEHGPCQDSQNLNVPGLSHAQQFGPQQQNQILRNQNQNHNLNSFKKSPSLMVDTSINRLYRQLLKTNFSNISSLYGVIHGLEKAMSAWVFKTSSSSSTSKTTVTVNANQNLNGPDSGPSESDLESPPTCKEKTIGMTLRELVRLVTEGSNTLKSANNLSQQNYQQYNTNNYRPSSINLNGVWDPGQQQNQMNHTIQQQQHNPSLWYYPGSKCQQDLHHFVKLFKTFGTLLLSVIPESNFPNSCGIHTLATFVRFRYTVWNFMELLRPQQQQNNNNCNTSTNLNNIIGSGANSNANGNGNAHQIQQQNRVAMAIYNADIQSNRSNLNNSGSNNCTSSMSNQTVSTVFSDLQSALCDDIWNKINERVWIRIREVLLNQQQAQPQSQKGPGQEISQEQLRLQFRDLANVGIALSAEYLRLGKNLNQTVMSASTLQKQKSENQFEQTFQTSQQNPGAELESVTNTLISSDSEDKLNIESEVLVVRSRIMELLRAAQRTVSILSSQSLPKKDTCQLLHASSTVCIGCQMSQSQESESQEIIVNQQQTSVKSQSEENQTQDLDGNKLDSDSDSEEKNNIKVNSQTQQQTKSSKTKTPTLDSIQTEALSIAITLLSCLFDKINNHLVVISQSCSREDVTMVANVLLGLISDSVYSDLESGDIESSQKQLRLYAVSLLRTVGYEDSEVIPSILSLTQQTTNLTPQKIANLNQLHSCQHTFDGKDKRLFMRLLQKLKTQTHCQSQAVNHKSEKPKVSSDNLNNQTCNAGSGGAGNTNQYETVTRKSNNSEISDSNFHTNLNLTIPPKTNSTLSHSGLGTNTSSTYGELDDLVTDISQSQTTSMQNNCQSLQNHYEHSNSNCKVEDTSATAVTAKEFAESHNQLLSAQQQVYTLQTQTETVNSAAKE